jgi:hypothetical protein
MAANTTSAVAFGGMRTPRECLARLECVLSYIEKLSPGIERDVHVSYARGLAAELADAVTMAYPERDTLH